MISLDTMQAKLGIEENEAIELELNGKQGDCAGADGARPSQRHAITVHLGLRAQRMPGAWAPMSGFNAYAIRASACSADGGGREDQPSGKGTYDLCVTKVHSIEHRGGYAQHDLADQGVRQVNGVVLACPGMRLMERGHHSLRDGTTEAKKPIRTSRMRTPAMSARIRAR